MRLGSGRILLSYVLLRNSTKPTLQPITSSALMLNLCQSNVMDVTGQETDDPDMVRPPQRGNDERRKRHRKKMVALHS